MQLRVQRLLEAKGAHVATIHPDASVREALSLMAEHNIGSLVVSSGGRAIEGIVSERDVVRRLHTAGPSILNGAVAAIMTTRVRTCRPDDELASLMALMTEHRVRHVPVVTDGELVGIVSIGDVVKARLGELEEDRRALHEFIYAR